MRLFSGYHTGGLWWFRICGVGLHGKDITRHPLLFSQRRGLHRGIQVGKWWLSFLR